MKDEDTSALPGADPSNGAHPFWAAMQLARLLRDEGFDRTLIAASFLKAAQSVAAENGDQLAFAMHMQSQASLSAEEVATAIIGTCRMVRN